MGSRQIIGLDLVRFGAACLVMLFHLCYWISAGGSDATAPNVAKVHIQYNELAIFRLGYVGTYIFFVLSGFVIAYSAHNSTASAFLRGRIVRLMPAIWLIAPISLASSALGTCRPLVRRSLVLRVRASLRAHVEHVKGETQ